MNQAVILAGGEGSRLFPITSWTPKPLLPVRGTPILVHTLLKLGREGWDEAIVCINETHREEFEYHAAPSLGIKIRFSTHPRSEEIGTAGEIAVAARFIKGDYFLVYYGDILSKVDTAEMRRNYEAFHPPPAAYLAVAPGYRIDKGVATIRDGDVLGIREKPVVDLPTLVGIDILRSDVLDHLEIGEDLHGDVLPRILRADMPVKAYAVADADGFIDVGSIDGYRRAQAWP